MKALLAFAFIATVSCSLLSYDSVHTVDPYDFFRGFLVAIGDKSDISDLLVCLNKLEPVREEMREGLKLIFTLEPENVVKGMTIVKEAFTKGYNTLTPCFNKYSKLRNLIGRLLNFNPITIGFRIILHLSKYTKMVTEAIDCLKVDNLLCVGTKIGGLLKSIFMESMSDEEVIVFDEDESLEFLKGFLRGIGDQGDANKLLKCLHTLDVVIDKIKKAIERIASEDPREIILGLRMFIEALREMIIKFRPCLEGFDALKKLWDAILKMDLENVLKKALLNLNRIIGEATYIIDCFDDDDFNCAGFGTGNLLKFLFLP